RRIFRHLFRRLSRLADVPPSRRERTPRRCTMIRHLLKLVWHRKRANALVILEIFFSFLVMAVVLTAAASLIIRWNVPLGFRHDDVWVMNVSAAGHAPEIEGADDDPMRAELDHLVREAKTFPQIAAAGLYDTL